MLVNICDLISGTAYDVNLNQICYFNRIKNEAGVFKYQIVLSNNTVITVTHKRWNRIKNLFSA